VQVLPATENLVDRGKLPGQPEQVPNGNGVLHDIEAEDLGPPRVWLEQRGEDADERRLACPIGAEKAEKLAALQPPGRAA